MPHHFDAVIMAAVQEDLVGHLTYLHNCDHALALGIHMPHARHVDLHAKGYYHCRETEGLADNLLWPLVVRDIGHRADGPFLVRGHVTTCTSGGFEKFEAPHCIEQVPYLFRYDELLPRMLEASGGTHIHVGMLSDAMLQRISEGIAKLGLPADRFVHVPFVPSLGAALLEYDVDVYIGSFPLGGGRATVEAMAAGLPLIIHSNYRSHFLSVEFEVYDGAMIWRQPDQLLAFLSSLSSSKLAEHARRARRHYEAQHRPECLQLAMEETARGAPQVTPPRPRYHPNLLQAYLDERHAFWTNTRAAVVVSEQEARHREHRVHEELAQLREQLQSRQIELTTRAEQERSRLKEAWSADVARVQDEAMRERARLDEALRTEVERVRQEAIRERARLDEAWRTEVERVRQETVRQMLVTARARRLLRKIGRRIGVIGQQNGPGERG